MYFAHHYKLNGVHMCTSLHKCIYCMLRKTKTNVNKTNKKSRFQVLHLLFPQMLRLCISAPVTRSQ